MESDLSSRVVALLQTTFSSNNTQDISQAESELLLLSQNIQEYLQALLNIISTNHPYITEKVKNSASFNLKKFVREKIEQKQIDSHLRENIARAIFSTITKPGIELAIRSSLGYTFVPVFGSDISDSQCSTLQNLLPLIGNSLLSNEAPAIYGGLKTIKAIYSVFSENPILLPIFKQMLDPLLCVGFKALESIKQSINGTNFEIMNESCEIIHEWANTITCIMEYFEIASRNKLAEIKDFTSLAELFGNILSFAMPDLNFSQPCLISVATEIVHCKFNQTKSQILQTVNLILQFLSETKKKQDESVGIEIIMNASGVDVIDSPFIRMLYRIIEPLTLSLHLVVSQPNLEHTLQVEYVSDLVNELLLILGKLASDKHFSSFFMNNFRGIIVEILLPILMSDTSELDKFDNSADEFVMMSRDICETKESDTFKTSAAKLLENMTVSIDGSLSFTVDFLINIIDMTISKRNPQDFAYMSDFSNSKYTNAQEESKLETALFIFSILSYFIVKRHDLLNKIETLIASHFPVFYSATDGILQNRICMFIHYFAENIFYKDSQSYNGLISILLNFCNPKITPKAVNFQAAETLSYMLQEESIMIRLEALVPNIISTFIYLIPIQSNKGFFEAMQEIISTNTYVIMPMLDRLVPALVIKIQSEMTKIREKNRKKKKDSIVIVKCWNIIRILAEAKEIDSIKVLEIENALLPVFNYMQNPNDIDFEDDIILFEVSLIRKCQAVSPVGWVLLNQLHLVQDKYGGTFIQLFPILNSYLFYGRDHLASNVEILKKIIDMCKICMFAIYKGKMNEATNSEGALLLQQILQIYNGIVDQYLNEILSAVVTKLNSAIKYPFFKARLMGVILSAFTYNCQLTFQILSSSSLSGQTYLESILSVIVSDPSLFSLAYDRKIAALGLSTIITQQCLPPEISGSLTSIFRALIQILGTSQKKQGSLDMQTSMMAEERGKDTDESDDDVMMNIRDKMFKDVGTEEMEAALALTTFISPVLDIDEYDTFRDLIKSYSTNSLFKLKTLAETLNKTELEELAIVLQCKKIRLTGFSSATTDVRRIVRPKKHKMND